MGSNSSAPLDLELTFEQEMTALSRRVLNPQGRRVYDLLIEGVGPFTDLFNSVHAANAYQVWAAISDLVDAPGGPHSDAECETLAREAAQDWMQIDHHTYESTNAFFDRWLQRLGYGR